jgi:hypothetical protein
VLDTVKYMCLFNQEATHNYWVICLGVHLPFYWVEYGFKYVLYCAIVCNVSAAMGNINNEWGGVGLVRGSKICLAAYNNWHFGLYTAVCCKIY